MAGDGALSDETTDMDRTTLVEEVGLLWEDLGMLRMDGRVLGYLMLSNAPQVSTSELRDALKASTGSISMSTRRLKEWGFIEQVAVAGERSHFFRAGDDVWGTFLLSEDKAYRKAKRLAERVLVHLDADGDVTPRARFENMRDYHEWLEEHHKLLSQRWEDYKSQKQAERASATRAGGKAR
jgi:DNA-binding transcriptional regulator GbsR (MarR family)